MRRIAVFLLFSVAVVVPLGTALLLSRTDRSALPELNAPQQPISAIAQISEVQSSQNVSLTLTTTAHTKVKGNGASGLVTEILLEPDTIIANGQVLYSVNAVPVLAWTDHEVLYRDLGVGDRGPDVAALQRFMSEIQDTELVEDGTFGADLRQAVREYQRSNGILPVDGIFRTTWILRIPEGFHLGVAHLELGQSAPGVETEVLESAPVIDSVIAATSSGTVAELGDGTYTFWTSGVPIRVSISQGEIEVPPSEYERIPQLNSAEGGSVILTGAMTNDVIISAYTVPPSSLTVAGGDTCLYAANGTGWEPLKVTVIESSANGSALVKPVDGHSDSPLTYLVNPSQAEMAAACQ